MLRRIISFVLLIVLLSGNFLFSQEENSLSNKFALSFKKLIADKDLKHASVGFYAQKVKTGEVLLEHNPDLSLIPASIQKNVTTAAALGTFGSTHKFKTILQYDGMIDSIGILNGNIYIKGGGDPSLGSVYFCGSEGQMSFLKEWEKAVNNLGIKKIDGAIIGDDQIFSSDLIPSTWSWGDIGNYYGSGTCGLSAFDNSYEVELESAGVSGELTVVKSIHPNIQYLEFQNEIMSGDVQGDNSSIFGSPYGSERLAKGYIPINQKAFKIKGSIPNPALLVAILFDETLRNSGIEISSVPKSIGLSDTRVRKDIYSQYSPALDSIVYWTNLKSINSYAESLINHLGLKYKNSGETMAGAQALKEYWQMKGIDTEGMFLADGSGLSRANGLTSRQMTNILVNIYGNEEFNSFYNSLPIAGKSGSLANMCKGTYAEGNLRAKSGYMSRVRSYAGYVKNRKGDLIAFTIIVNNYSCSASVMKQKIEKVLSALAETE